MKIKSVRLEDGDVEAALARVLASVPGGVRFARIASV